MDKLRQLLPMLFNHMKKPSTSLPKQRALEQVEKRTTVRRRLDPWFITVPVEFGAEIDPELEQVEIKGSFEGELSAGGEKWKAKAEYEKIYVRPGMNETVAEIPVSSSERIKIHLVDA